MGLFFTGTEKRDLSGFSGSAWDIEKGKGTRIGLIFPQGFDPPISSNSDEG
jgi:hypothetical protein